MSRISVLRQAVQDVRDKAAELRDEFGDEDRAKAMEYAAKVFEHALHEIATSTYDYVEGAALLGKDPRTLERWKREGLLIPAQGATGVRFTLRALLDAAGMHHPDLMAVAARAESHEPRTATGGVAANRTPKTADADSHAGGHTGLGTARGIGVVRTPKPAAAGTIS